MKVYYFGCLGFTGHHFYEVSSRGALLMPSTYGSPWGYKVDGGLQPAEPRFRQGDAALHEKDGWTCLAWWDMTVDPRQASCSALVAEGSHGLDAMLALLGEHFPAVAERQTVPVYLRGTTP